MTGRSTTNRRTTPSDPRPEAWLAARFDAQRPHLRAVAYRMLGNLADADDIVQEAWLRLSRVDAGAVDNLGGWLTTVVARLCLDALRARRSRHEAPAGLELPEPIVTAPDVDPRIDPEQEALLADSVGLALLIVLEQLSPAERLAFVLHDTFGVPFEEIALIVERSTEATRQLASRGRRRLRATNASDRPTAALSATERRRHRELVEAFLEAARDGRFEALLGILDPEVVVHADTGRGPSPLGPSRVIRGAAAVAQQALAFRNLAPGARPATVNGLPGLVVLQGDRLFAVLGFSFRADRIVKIDILADPARLARLQLPAID